MQVIKIVKKDESNSDGFQIGYELELENGKVVYAHTPRMDWDIQEFNSEIEEGDIQYLRDDVFGHPEANPVEFEGEAPGFGSPGDYNLREWLSHTAWM